MTRRLSNWEIMRSAKARREGALARDEFRYPTAPRVAPAGITSAPIKAEDPSTRALIDEALNKRSAANG